MLELVDRYRPRTERGFVERVVAAVREHVQRPDLEVSLLLTGDEEIAELHNEYLDDPTPTDVMSFAIDNGAEVVVSVETARRVAKRNGTPMNAEVALYIVARHLAHGRFRRQRRKRTSSHARSGARDPHATFVCAYVKSTSSCLRARRTTLHELCGRRCTARDVRATVRAFAPLQST